MLSRSTASLLAFLAFVGGWSYAALFIFATCTRLEFARGKISTGGLSKWSEAMIAGASFVFGSLVSVFCYKVSQQAISRVVVFHLLFISGLVLLGGSLFFVLPYLPSRGSPIFLDWAFLYESINVGMIFWVPLTGFIFVPTALLLLLCATMLDQSSRPRCRALDTKH